MKHFKSLGHLGFKMSGSGGNMTLEELNIRFNVLVENMDSFFFVIMGLLITFLQIGVGFLITGAVNAKNSTNIMFKNMIDVLIAAVTWWLFGYTLAYGDGNPFIGMYYYQGGKDISTKKKYSHFFLQISWASSPASIASGTLVDRISYAGYLVFSTCLAGIIYPIACHWAWHHEGWLTLLGYKDFSGSGIVNLLSGSCALVGGVILGPRINRFPNLETEHKLEEKIRFSSHSIPMTALGTIILTTGWFSFSGASVLHITQPNDGQLVAKAIINTWLANAGGAFCSLCIFRTGVVDGDSDPQWSFANAMNGGVAGMAAICAHSDMMDMWAAFVNGLFAAFSYSMFKKLTAVLKIDDPLDVIAIHFGGGLWGTVGGTLLRQDSLVGGYVPEAGWYFAKNLVGALSIIAWSGGCCIVIFGGLRLAGLLRCSPEDELVGGDITMHNEPAYQGIPCYYEYMLKKHDINIQDLERSSVYTITTITTDLGQVRKKANLLLESIPNHNFKIL